MPLLNVDCWSNDSKMIMLKVRQLWCRTRDWVSEWDGKQIKEHQIHRYEFHSESNLYDWPTESSNKFMCRHAYMHVMVDSLIKFNELMIRNESSFYFSVLTFAPFVAEKLSFKRPILYKCFFFIQKKKKNIEKKNYMFLRRVWNSDEIVFWYHKFYVERTR